MLCEARSGQTGSGGSKTISAGKTAGKENERSILQTAKKADIIDLADGSEIPGTNHSTRDDQSAWAIKMYEKNRRQCPKIRRKRGVSTYVHQSPGGRPGQPGRS